MSYRDVVLADRPRAYWPLDEGTGTVARDLSGHGYNATYTNTAGFTYAVGSPKMAGGRGIVFASTAYVAPPSGAYQTVTDFSRELWIKTTSVVGQVMLVAQYGAANGEDWWFLNTNSLYEHAMYNGGYIYGPAGALTTGDTTRIAQDGRGHHLVLTRANAGRVRIYMDGYMVSDQVGGTSANTLSGTTAQYIGRAIPDNNREFLGTMSDVATYDYALSPGQVLAHYRAGTGFDQGTGRSRARLR